MHIICFSNPQHHLNEVEAVLSQLVVDHTKTVVVPPFDIPVGGKKNVVILDGKPKGQKMQFFFPQVLLFVFFNGDVPKIIEEIWAKQKAENSQKPK